MPVYVRGRERFDLLQQPLLVASVAEAAAVVELHP